MKNVVHFSILLAMMSIAIAGCKKEVAVTGVTVSPTTVSLAPGGTQQLAASVQPSNATNKKVTWRSSNTALATVSDGGLITIPAIATAGVVTITVTTEDGDKSADCSVTVLVPVTGINIAPAGNVTVEVGKTATLTATVAPSNASNKTVTWSSLNTNIATVNAQTGVVTGVSVGTANIRATAADGSGVTADKSVTVATSVIRITGITIAPSGDVSVVVNETATLTATVAPDNATNKSVTWSSLNTGIATVDAQTGLVTGVSAGTATIRATAADGSGVTATKTVTVITAIVRVTGITLTPTGDMTVEMGRTVILTANVTPDNATNKNVAWSSDNTGIAMVNEAGVVTGISAGATTVRATTADGSEITATKNITVIASVPMTGSGTQNDPYIIRTPAHLDAVRDNISAHYKLGNNIDLSGYLAYGGIGYAKWGTYGWDPIWTFTGRFDGAGYKITGIWLMRPYRLAGLFGAISNGSVQSLGVEIASNGITILTIAIEQNTGGVAARVENNSSITNCSVTGGAISGTGYGGGVAGVVAESSITNCYATVTVSGTSIGGVAGNVVSSNITNCFSTGVISGGIYASGVAGIVSNSSITNCYATGSVSSSLWVGGVAGTADSNSIITNCYTTGTVSGSVRVGGVVGAIENNCSISNCYATGTISGNSNIGGVVGVISGSGNKITNCYASGIISCNGDYVGGVVGYVENNSGTITNSVSLSPSVTSSANTVHIGRVAGFVFQFESLVNNWARSNMTVTANGVSKTLIKAGNMLDGADCDATPAANWWTTAAPNGPGWSNTIWTFSTGQLPKLR